MLYRVVGHVVALATAATLANSAVVSDAVENPLNALLPGPAAVVAAVVELFAVATTDV